MSAAAAPAPNHRFVKADLPVVDFSESLDWDFVATAPPPRRSGTVSVKLNQTASTSPIVHID